jgi:lactate dehydrogenase-like 2-hydroxyacid dehydrogenase
MDKPRILLTRRWPAEVEAALATRFDVVLNADDHALTMGQLAEAMRQFDALCPTVTDKLPAELFAGQDLRVRLIANYGAGIEHVDLAAAHAAGVAVSNTPDVLTEATAETALMLMLMAARRASEGERELRAGQWTGWRPTHMVGQSLYHKRLGLVGFGRIARETARLARDAFGMRVAYHSRSRAPVEVEMELHAHHEPDLFRLAAESDLLSLHCPGGADTYHLVDAALLARMKPTAILVNTARGSVVDSRALAEALAAGRVAAAGLDVYEGEPQVPSALLELPNVALLPHLGSATIETRRDMGMRAMENLVCFFEGRPLHDPIV